MSRAHWAREEERKKTTSSHSFEHVADVGVVSLSVLHFCDNPPGDWRKNSPLLFFIFATIKIGGGDEPVKGGGKKIERETVVV
jgi:hypothetical protein